MARDYYATLGLTKSANADQIKASYRKLALQWHPSRHRNSSQLESAVTIFKEVAEAYSVLIDQKARAQYDSVGEDFTKQSVVIAAPMELSKAETVFEAFFGTANPFASLIDGERELWQELSQQKLSEPPPIEMDCFVTLEELYNGCTKVFKVRRDMIDAEQQLVHYDDMLTVVVGKGWKDGTTCKFDRNPNDITGQVIFTIKTLPHKVFSRNDDDLLHTAKLTLIQSLSGFRFDLITLDKRTLHIPVDEIVHPKYKKIMHREGMMKANGERGDLIISFDIEFPELLKEEQKVLMTFALTLPSNLSIRQKRLMALALRLPEKDGKMIGLNEEQGPALDMVINTIKPLPPP
jgi:DnaJ-class molecular chaperone